MRSILMKTKESGKGKNGAKWILWLDLGFLLIPDKNNQQMREKVKREMKGKKKNENERDEGVVVH